MRNESTKTLKAQFIEQVELRNGMLDLWISRKAVPWRVGLSGEQLRDARGELIPDFVPTNLTQFCLWEARLSSAASGTDATRLRKISRTSFDKAYHEDLFKVTDVKIKAVTSCLEHQLATKDKASVIAELQQKIVLLEKIAGEQQKESRLARFRLGEMTTKYRLRHEESRRLIAQLKTDLTAGQEKIAALTALVAKVAPLRPVKPSGGAS